MKEPTRQFGMGNFVVLFENFPYPCYVARRDRVAIVRLDSTTVRAPVVSHGREQASVALRPPQRRCEMDDGRPTRLSGAVVDTRAVVPRCVPVGESQTRIPFPLLLAIGTRRPTKQDA